MSTIVIPQGRWPGKLLNINAMRGHTANTGRLARPWRELGFWTAKEAKLTTYMRPVEIWARFRFPTNHKRDTANLYPTIKALVDGLTDARVFVDDCDGIVYGPFLEREYPNGPAQITLEIKVRV